MSNMQARVTSSDRAFHVEGYEKIEYDLLYVDGIFAPDQEALAGARDGRRSATVLVPAHP